MYIVVKTGTPHNGSFEHVNYVKSFITERFDIFSENIDQVNVHFSGHSLGMDSPDDCTCVMEIQMIDGSEIHMTGKGEITYDALWDVTDNVMIHLKDKISTKKR